MTTRYRLVRTTRLVHVVHCVDLVDESAELRAFCTDFSALSPLVVKQALRGRASSLCDSGSVFRRANSGAKCCRGLATLRQHGS
jgi:hypothetical protein